MGCSRSRSVINKQVPEGQSLIQASSSKLYCPVRKPHSGDHSNLAGGWSDAADRAALPSRSTFNPFRRPARRRSILSICSPCHLAWEQEEEPSAAWELLAAAQSLNPDTRAHARALLASSRHFSGLSPGLGLVPRR